MVISTIEESEIPEHFSVFTLVFNSTANSGTTTVVLAAPGHHPKCRIARAQATPLVWATGGDAYAIEDGDGNDAATIAVGATTAAFLPGSFTLIQGQVFERNEAIVVNKSTQGSSTNAYLIVVQLESIH